MDFMSSLPENDQVILVGHSAGGLSVTQATHKFSKKIRLAVYLAATMLKMGYWTDQDIQDGVPDLSSFGDVYELGFGLGSDHPPTSAIVKKEFQRKIVYQMSPQEVDIFGDVDPMNNGFARGFDLGRHAFETGTDPCIKIR
ncbi:unnamed protein product [Dovyalis caffra]|uniref:Uncharacterized protein n=1 Tax=Dovyalis caffra TaxID=77055 RepID=A0AAV1RTI2_9ROSI|nr:unnamed protein product [Dovyalis caffra]